MGVSDCLTICHHGMLTWKHCVVEGFIRFGSPCLERAICLMWEHPSAAAVATRRAGTRHGGVIEQTIPDLSMSGSTQERYSIAPAEWLSLSAAPDALLTEFKVQKVFKLYPFQLRLSGILECHTGKVRGKATLKVPRGRHKASMMQIKSFEWASGDLPAFTLAGMRLVHPSTYPPPKPPVLDRVCLPNSLHSPPLPSNYDHSGASPGRHPRVPSGLPHPRVPQAVLLPRRPGRH